MKYIVSFLLAICVVLPAEVSAQFPECEVASIDSSCTPQILNPPTVSVSGLTATVQWDVSGAYDYMQFTQSTNGTWGGTRAVYFTTENVALERGNTYAFKVAACSNMHGCSLEWTSANVMLPSLSPPNQPSVSLMEATVGATWGAVVDATRYEVQVRTNGTWGSGINVGNALSYAFQGIVDAEYAMRVRACDISTCSSYSVISDSVTVKRVATPVIHPAGTSHDGVVAVSLEAISGVTLRYTLDGLPVDESSPVYTGPFNIRTGVLKVRGFRLGWLPSFESTAEFTLSGDATSVIIFVHTDILGSVIGETDSDGKLIRVKEYKPFGERKEEM